MAKRSRETSCSLSADSPLSADDDDDTVDLAIKYQHIETLILTDSQPVMRCELPPHRHGLNFETQEQYEIHYAKEHTNRCAECQKNFPSAHFLTLHIEENHNPLRESLQAKGEKTYGCLVEDCDRKCSTPQKRRLHMIDKHGFPKFYNFRVIDNGIDKATSMLRESHRRRISLSTDQTQTMTGRRRGASQAEDPRPESAIATTTSSDRPDVTPHAINVTLPISSKSLKGPKENVDELTNSMSALQFVPTSVLRNKKTN